MDDTEEYQLCDSVDETTSLASQDTLKNAAAEVVLYRLDETDELCRVCLKTGTIPIFSSEDLSVDLNHFTGIDVKLDDFFPQHLCPLCRKSLATASALRELARKSDRILKKQSEELIIEEESLQEDYSNKTDDGNTIESLIDDEQTSDGGSVYLEYAETLKDDSDDENEMRESNLDKIISNPDTIEPEDEIPYLAANPSKSKFPQCEICEITFRTMEQVEDHCSIHKDVVVCEVCKNVTHYYTYETHLYAHKIYYEQKRLHSKKVKCSICNKLIGKCYIKQHIAMHDLTDTTNCSVCGKTLKKRYVNEHLQRIHFKKALGQGPKTIKTVECPVCTCRVKESNYKAHITSHRSQKMYICEVCGKELASKCSYATHLLTHKDEYNFKCDLCPYRGKHKGLLRTHIRTHTKDYSYKCETCDAYFLTKSNLIAHRKTHSTAQFVCSECGKCYARERSLREHKMSMHDGIKAFSCDLCPKHYGKKDVLLAHKKRVHKVNNSSGLVGGQSRASYLLAKTEN